MSQDARPIRTRFLLQMLERKFASAPLGVAPTTLDGWAPAHLLVVAPHPDDEVIGCGGLIGQCLAAGGRVTVLFLTVEAGRSIVKPSLHAGADRRLGECAEAQRVLGYQAREHFDWPERGLASAGPEFDALVKRLAERFAAHAPDAVLLPNPADVHPDHAAAALAGGEALRLLRRAGRVWGLRTVMLYEVWGPARLDAWCRLDSALLALKRRALDCYASQLESVDYHAIMDTLAHTRAATLGAAAGAAVEAFEHADGYAGGGSAAC